MLTETVTNIIILSDRDDSVKTMCRFLLCWPYPPYYSIWLIPRRELLVALILEAASREVHHFATLLGYGACAINPYLAR